MRELRIPEYCDAIGLVPYNFSSYPKRVLLRIIKDIKNAIIKIISGIGINPIVPVPIFAYSVGKPESVFPSVNPIPMPVYKYIVPNVVNIGGILNFEIIIPFTAPNTPPITIHNTKARIMIKINPMPSTLPFIASIIYAVTMPQIFAIPTIDISMPPDMIVNIIAMEKSPNVGI